MNKKNLIKGTLLGLMGLVLICTNSAMAEEPCTITIDGNIEYIEYWDGDYLYSKESSIECYEDYISCYEEGMYLGPYYSTCEFQPNSPTVLENGDLKVCGIEYVSNSNGATGCITIQGKNVGATTTGAGPDAPSASYGNYYQWGDNTPRTESNWLTNYSPDDNVWGGGNDELEGMYGNTHPLNSYPVTNESERQGPCDVGYHVPSAGEWYALMDMRAGERVRGQIFYFENIIPFYTDFQLPFAHFLKQEDGSLFEYTDVNLWSSSKNYGGAAYSLQIFQDDSYALYANGGNDRAAGVPVRCFKNSYLEFPSGEGGDSEIIVNIAALNGGQNTCSGEDFIFPAITASPVVQTIKLAKKFQCIFGNAANKAVTLHLSGDLTDGNGNVIPGANVKLSNPEWTSTPTGLKNGTTVFSGQTFMGGGKTLFNKVENMIGEAQGSGVQIEITVPAGTPDGTYQGTIILDF